MPTSKSSHEGGPPCAQGGCSDTVYPEVCSLRRERMGRRTSKAAPSHTGQALVAYTDQVGQCAEGARRPVAL